MTASGPEADAVPMLRKGIKARQALAVRSLASGVMTDLDPVLSNGGNRRGRF